MKIRKLTLEERMSECFTKKPSNYKYIDEEKKMLYTYNPKEKQQESI